MARQYTLKEYLAGSIKARKAAGETTRSIAEAKDWYSIRSNS